LKTYFDAAAPLPDFLDNLRREAPEASVLDATTIGLTDASFRPAPFDPFALVEDVLVVPPPELAGLASDTAHSPSPNDIVLMPGLAFGSGRHETTRLVAQAFWEIHPRPDSVLDIGTGSGILAIFARKAGVARVDAVEISEEALENARGNFARNSCGDVGLYRSVAEVTGPYDMILGNLLTPTILHLRPEMLRLLGPGGRIILSGVTLAEVHEVESACGGFHRIRRKDAEDWSCLVLEISKIS
jgi:ribosomal protein L11 methylase PrmA